MDYINTVTGSVKVEELGRGLVMTDFMERAMKDANIRTIGNKIIPGLRKRGLTEEQIEGFLAGNPARFFA